MKSTSPMPCKTIPPKFEGIGLYGPRHAAGHPQTSQIPFKIVQKQVFVKKQIFQFFGLEIPYKTRVGSPIGPALVLQNIRTMVHNESTIRFLTRIGRDPERRPSTTREAQKRALQAQKNAKTTEKLTNLLFHKNHFFGNFKWYLGGLGVSGGMAWTVRCDSLELWQGLVLHGMGEVEFHVFGKYQKLTSSPNTSKLVLVPPDWSSSLFFNARVPSQEL